MATHEEFCIYIQKIKIDMKDDEIMDIIENDLRLGKISKIDHVHKTGKFLSIFVYFIHIIWSPKSLETLTSISNGHSYKMHVDNNIYWIARQKCMNYNVIQLLANRIYKMEEMIETQNLQIAELMSIIKKEQTEQNDDSFSGDKIFFYISESPSSSSSSDSLFNF